jgi:AcrR family transcriptional regulator
MNKKRNPKQNRSIETKNRILESGLKLFSQKGLQGTSSREIVADAGVAIGSFYSYFKDKRDLFIELLKTHRMNVGNILNGYSSKTMPGENLTEFIKQLIQTVWEAHGETHEIDQKAEILRSMDPEIDAILKEQQEVNLNRLISLLRLIDDRLRVNNIEAAARLIGSIIRETFHANELLNPEDMRIMIDELSDMISRYLFE